MNLHGESDVTDGFKRGHAARDPATSNATVFDRGGADSSAERGRDSWAHAPGRYLRHRRAYSAWQGESPYPGDPWARECRRGGGDRRGRAALRYYRGQNRAGPADHLATEIVHAVLQLHHPGRPIQVRAADWLRRLAAGRPVPVPCRRVR